MDEDEEPMGVKYYRFDFKFSALGINRLLMSEIEILFRQAKLHPVQHVAWIVHVIRNIKILSLEYIQSIIF